jgi:hypothetical protein
MPIGRSGSGIIRCLSVRLIGKLSPRSTGSLAFVSTVSPPLPRRRTERESSLGHTSLPRLLPARFMVIRGRLVLTLAHGAKLPVANVPLIFGSCPDPATMARAIDAIATHAPGSRTYRVMTGVAYYAGMRPSEVAMLRVGVLELPSEGWGRIHVVEADISFDEPGEPKTGPRVVPIPSVLVTMVKGKR